MKRLYANVKIPAVLMVAAAFLFAAGSVMTQELPGAEPFDGGAGGMPVNFITAEELKSLIEEGSENILVVDNSPELAYEEEHIPGAVNFPWVQNIKPPVTLPRNKTLVLYCPCGPGDADSIDMSKKLRRFGYFKTKVLEGGWFKWLELGFPVESNMKEES